MLMRQAARRIKPNPPRRSNIGARRLVAPLFDGMKSETRGAALPSLTRPSQWFLGAAEAEIRGWPDAWLFGVVVTSRVDESFVHPVSVALLSSVETGA